MTAVIDQGLDRFEAWLTHQYGRVLRETGNRWHDARGTWEGPEYVNFRMADRPTLIVTVAANLGIQIRNPDDSSEAEKIRGAVSELTRALATERLVSAIRNYAVVEDDQWVQHYRVLTVSI